MKKKIIGILFCIFLFRILLAYLYFNILCTSDEEKKEYVLEIQELQKIDEEKNVYIAKITNNFLKQRVILNVYMNSNDQNSDNLLEERNLQTSLNIGDVIKVYAKFNVPQFMKNPGEFNYKLYLNSVNVCGTMSVNYGKYEIQNTKVSKSMKYKIKDILVGDISKYFESESNYIFFKSIVYGDTLNLDECIKETFSNLGISHIISASGTNLAILISLINLVLNRIKIKNEKVKKVYKKIIVIIECVFVLIFSCLTNGKYAIIRATISFGIKSVFRLRSKKISNFKCMIISLGIVFFINPYCVFNTGLQFSYLAILGIVTFGSNYKTKDRLDINKDKNKNKNKKQSKIKTIIFKLLKYILNNFKITFAIFLMTLPIQICSFGKISLIFFISNFICQLCNIPMLFLGIAGIFIPIGFVRVIIFKIFQMLLAIFLRILNVLSKINYIVSLPSEPIYIVLMYYILILVIILCKKYFCEKTQIRLKKIKKNVYIKQGNIIIIIAILTFICILTISNIYIQNENYVYFFNVGQGAMSIIHENGKNILIDIGSTTSNLAFNTIDNFMKSKNIHNIDVVLLTHFDSDHTNGLIDLIEKYSVENVICSYNKLKTQNENDVLEYIKEQEKIGKLKLENVKAGDTLCVGNILIDIVYSLEVTANESIDNNEKGIVFKITTQKYNYLYMGDATKNVENKLLENEKLKDINVLIVGHHGSKTSTSEEFIQKIHPTIGIISSKSSVYGHPASETLEVLKKYNVNILQTQYLGAIKM